MLDVASWIAAFGVSLFVVVPLQGAMIAALWSWFIAPATGAPTIGFVEGIGLAVCLRAFGQIANGHQTPAQKKIEQSVLNGEPALLWLSRGFRTVIFNLLATIAFGWLIHTVLMRSISN